MLSNVKDLVEVAISHCFPFADNFKAPKRDLDKAFRFCVSDVYKGKLYS